MRKLVPVLFAFLLLSSASVFAQDHPLTVDLARNHVDITTGFNGSHLVLYGVKAKGGRVAVVLRGPVYNATVRKKESVFGTWMNRTSVTYSDVPVFYDYALSAPEEELLSAVNRREMWIGLAALYFESDGDSDLSDEDKKAFKTALVRNKQAEGLFPKKAKEIQFMSESFFKTVFYIPPNVPTGHYVIETFLFSEDAVIDKRVTNLQVAQVGFSAGVDKFAESFAFAYALLIVAFAMFAGWFSNQVRRRK